MITIRSISTVLAMFLVTASAFAQPALRRVVALDGAREVVAEINGGYGTLYLKRGSGEDLLTIREKQKDDDDDTNIEVDYYIEDGIGYLTVDLGTEGADDMNALACLMKGSSSRTWYLSISDRVPVRFDITLGAGRASLDLTGVHVRAFHLDAGAGSVRLKANSPNREEIGTMTVSAGVGSLRAEKLGNLRFNVLDFEGGLGEYVLDCTGDLPDRARIHTDVGVGSLTVVLPKGIAAKAVTDDNFLSSRKLYGFVRKTDETYVSRDYGTASRHVRLDLQSGLGSIAVRWGK